MRNIVTIDLGSNSFRVLVYDCLNFKPISEYNQVVGMADKLIQTGEISQDAINRVITAINDSSKKLGYDPKDAICVTTAAMRMAKNSNEVLSCLLKNTGAKFNIIDGKEEARLTLLAVKYALKREKLDSDNFILLDIGGGSTEIIINIKDRYFSKSFNFGIVTLTQKYSTYTDLIDDLETKKIDIKNFLSELDIEENFEKFNFVATAGTPTTIAAIKLGQDFFHYDKEQVNGTKVKLSDLQDCLDIFKNSNEHELLQLVGKGRVEFIEVGIYIYRAIFEVLNKKESIVLDDGLREGVAINQCLIN
ncbi:exopolyphosphatase [Malaciobacter molluscorum]|uniref:Ppx/GppA phosphatase family protein n=1 Tax=Malaciobacter molluscorum TaxID=1032072 RepID=UPI00100AC24D|nr:exopolyphosphatase [Malaciobacter molluscorum]RXJ93442.1 exopolyphosphatase [Malaciobacter molluscorum]